MEHPHPSVKCCWDSHLATPTCLRTCLRVICETTYYLPSQKVAGPALLVPIILAITLECRRNGPRRKSSPLIVSLLFKITPCFHALPPVPPLKSQCFSLKRFQVVTFTGHEPLRVITHHLANNSDRKQCVLQKAMVQERPPVSPNAEVSSFQSWECSIS